MVIPAGNYIIIDSQPETWSRNAESPCGFVKVEGYPVQADPATKDDKEGQSESKGTVNAHITVDGECSNPIDMLVDGCDAGLPGITVELTITYIPPDYSQDVPAGSKFILKTSVKTMEKELEGSIPDPAEDVYFTFRAPELGPDGRITGIVTPVCGMEGIICSPEWFIPSFLRT